MNKLEVIKLILKEKEDEDIYRLFNSNKSYNLIYLCVLNNKYLNKVLDQILNSKDIIDKNVPTLAYLLSSFPDLIDKISNDLLNKLDIYDWTTILSKQPQLFDKCKIIDKADLVRLCIIFANNPELVNKYKEVYKNKNTNTLFGYILNYKEDLNIDFSELDPSYLNKNIKELDYGNWLHILTYNPDLIKICPIANKINKDLYYFFEDSIINLVSKQISFKYLLPSLYSISNTHLTILINNQPQLIEELNINLKNLNNNDWVDILSKQPQLISECNKLDELTTYNWLGILIKQPKLIEYYKEIHKLGNTQWSLILLNQPSLTDKCNKFDHFNSDNWYSLLSIRPEFIDECKDTSIINRKHKIDY